MGVLTTAVRMWLTRSTKPFLFTAEYDKTLPFAQEEQLGLYIHIPFCRSLCAFCPYCKVVYDEALIERYLDALIEEIHMVGRSQPGKKKVTSLYLGGGSPALAADRLGELLAAVEEHFTLTEGVGIELHPEDVTEERLRVLKAAGVTKISIGIQSFQEGFLDVLGRDKRDWSGMFSALAAVPFETVSMDFIFALPGQTFDHLRRDIDMAFFQGANHVAIYPFIDFSFANANLPPMAGREKRRLLDAVTAYCAEKGYARESIWTFSSDGAAKYSSMTRECFLGFGCSATTLLSGQFKINTFSVEEYIVRIRGGSLATALTLRFTPRQRMVYWLFWTAYTTKVDPADFETFFGRPLAREFGAELWLSRLLGFVRRENGVYCMTPKGAYAYHHFEGYYTLAYIDKMWGILRERAFPEHITL